MNWIENLKIELTCKETSPGFIEEDSSVRNRGTRILDPKVARCKGRPPEKRKVSKVDQNVKKKLRKKDQKRSQKSTTYQSQEEVILNYLFIYILYINTCINIIFYHIYLILDFYSRAHVYLEVMKLIADNVLDLKLLMGCQHKKASKYMELLSFLLIV
jgi:hypothetical protein